MVGGAKGIAGISGGEAVKKQKKDEHTHNWFPVAIDYEHEFGFYECVGCTETMWRNLYQVVGEDALYE